MIAFFFTENYLNMCFVCLLFSTKLLLFMDLDFKQHNAKEPYKTDLDSKIIFERNIWLVQGNLKKWIPLKLLNIQDKQTNLEYFG